MIRSNRKTECPILDLVEARYSTLHWVFLREIRNDTGFQSTRSADALAVGLYHSRGQLLIGFEKKVSRPDWLKELREPDKAEAFAQFCDQWYIVVPEEDIVKLDELPPTWGLLLAKGKRIRTVKQAPTLIPKPIDRGLMASIVQRAIENAIKPYLITKEEKNQEIIDEAFERGKHSAEYELEKARALQEQVSSFEESSGIKMNKWDDGKKIGNAVKAILNSDSILKRSLDEINYAIRQIEGQTLPALKEYADSLTKTV